MVKQLKNEGKIKSCCAIKSKTKGAQNPSFKNRIACSLTAQPG